MLDDFSAVVAAIYDSSLNPSNWPNTLESIAQYFDSEGTVIIFYRGYTQASFIHSPGVEHAVRIYLEEEWWRHDIHAQRAIEMSLSGLDVFNDQTVATPEEIETLPIYVDFFRRVGFGWLMSCVLLPAADSLVAITLTRAKAKGPYNSEEMRVYALVGRHVEQALRISMRLENLDETQVALLAGLDALDAGIFALADDGRVLFANREADTQFRSHFDRVDGRIVPRNAADRVRFQAMLGAATHALGERESMRRAPPRCSIVNGDDGRRVAAWAFPLSGATSFRLGMVDAVRTLVLTAPLERSEVVDPVVLRDVFELTLGEARLTSLLGHGMAVREAAGVLGVTEGTARNVLKQVFAKMGVHRQSDLVRQVSSLAMVSPPEGRATGLTAARFDPS